MKKKINNRFGIFIEFDGRRFQVFSKRIDEYLKIYKNKIIYKFTELEKPKSNFNIIDYCNSAIVYEL